MSSNPEVNCQCEKRREALWSYCADDFFCPRCGTPIAWLTSENRYPSDAKSGRIWVYPQTVDEQTRFYFPLKLRYLNHERALCSRNPQIDVKLSKGTGNQHFSAIIEILDTSRRRTRRRSFRPCLVALRPAGPQESVKSLPCGGVKYRIWPLIGEFSETELELLVANKPSIKIELFGHSIEPSREDKQLFRVTASGQLDLTLAIHAVDAPILITNRVDTQSVVCAPVLEKEGVPTGNVYFQMDQVIEAGTTIFPETGKEWTTHVVLDTTKFDYPGQQVRLTFLIEALATRFDSQLLELRLERVEKRGVKFEPERLDIPEMFLGEVRSNTWNDPVEHPEDPSSKQYIPVIRKLFVYNVGKKTVCIQDLKVEHAYDFNWITVQWGNEDEHSKLPDSNRKLELAQGEQGEICVRIDLRHLRMEELPESRSLSARILVERENEEEPEKLDVLVSEINQRTPCPQPLAIDFGNTSSYAAMFNPDPRVFPHLGNDVVAVHDLRSPESFPTALFFEEAPNDWRNAKYEIGNVALAKGTELARSGGYGALVTDLKRWMGQPDRKKIIIDDQGHNQQYDVATLICLYLKRMIERVESVLREYSIDRICVSFPAKYSLRRRKIFHKIIDTLCEVVNAERGNVPIERIQQDVDEANAVAVSSVLDPDIVQKYLEEKVTPEHPQFVVGCFDLGGGSLDTALIRFSVADGLIDVPEYSTEYLGIGGHENFGGDNVTWAFAELLKKRIEDALTAAKMNPKQCLKCIPSPTEKDFVDADRRKNYEVLWQLAEEIKIFQCTHAGTEPEKEELLRLAQSVQFRLENELILDPSAAGTLRPNQDVRQALRQLVEREEYLIPLREVYDHKIESDLIGLDGGYTVRERIEEGIDELKRFASDKSSIDFVVFSGAGSCLPLVEELFKTRLPQTVCIQNKERTKFRVAHGLARFLDAVTHRSHHFKRSSDYTVSEFGTVQSGTKKFIQLVPNCAPVNDVHKWYPFVVGRNQTLVPLDRLIDLVSGQLWIHRRDRGQPLAKHGCFDLTERPTTLDGGPGERLAQQELEMLEADNSKLNDKELQHAKAKCVHEELKRKKATGAVRLVGSECEMELEIKVGDQSLGIWTFRSIDEEPR